MSAENPYEAQTSVNTSTPWLDDGPAVEVDLDGLREYARLLADQQADIASRAAYLRPLGEMPDEAWNGDVLGEADAVRAQLVANAAELMIYLGKLGESLRNVGNAAVSIADRYRSGDAIAAASLADVRAAFDATPAGAGPGTAPKPPPEADSAQWREGPVTPVSAYQTVQTAAGPDGERREVSTFTAPGGAITVTTTIFDRGGREISASTTRTTTREDGPVRTTREETFGPDGEVAATTETKQTYDRSTVTESSTENVDSKGRTTSLTTEKLDPDTGVKTTSTFRPDESGLLQQTNRIQVGPPTPGPSGSD
jgi:hypothetical protein